MSFGECYSLSIVLFFLAIGYVCSPASTGASAPTSPPQDLAIRLIPGVAAPAMFLPGEIIELTVEGASEAAKAVSLELYDFEGRAVLTERWTAAASSESTPAPPPRPLAPEEGRLIVRFASSGSPSFGTVVRDFSRLGVFRAVLTCRDAADGILATDETTFARVPDVRLRTRRPDSPFGIGAYYAVRFNPAQLAIASAIQQLMGAAWNRDELLWDLVEAEPGKWTWEKTDRAIRVCRARNIEVLGLLDYWGRWAEPLTDEAYDAYANYVKRMVERYKPDGEFARAEGWTDGWGVREWEVWNEPATFWTGSGAQFGRLLRMAHDTIKAVDPECRVYFSEAGPDFNRAAVAKAGLDAFDGITPHYYCPPRSPEQGHLLRQMKGTVTEFEELGAGGRPLWVSEFGWHSTMDPEEMRNQAVYLVRSHVFGLAAGLDKFFWYNFVNDTPDKHTSHYGLVNREDWTPRLGFGSYVAMVHFLDDARHHAQIELVRPANLFVFAKEGGGSVAVLWSSGAAGSIDIEGLGAVALFDLMGNTLDLEEFPGVDAFCHRIPLGFAPVYLVAPDTAAADLAARLRAGDIHGISPVEVRPLPLVGPVAPGLSVRVAVENVGARPVSGVVSLSAPEGWAIRSRGIGESETRIETLAPGETRIVSFQYAKTEVAEDNRYAFAATFRDATGDEAVGESILSAFVLPKRAIVVDGDDADWKDVPVVPLDTPDYAVGLVPYMDWNLSAQVAMAWDDANLYFLARVRDNEFAQPETGTLMWQGDSIQIAFDTRPTASTADGNDTDVRDETAAHPLHKSETSDDAPDAPGLYLYGLARTSRGDETWSWPTPGRRGDRSAEGLRFVFRQSDKDRYVYEAAIPHRLLAPLEFVTGATFRSTLLINDNDGGGRRGWLELTPGIGTGYEPKHYIVWTLTD